MSEEFNEEMYESVIELTDDEGNVVPFEILLTFDFEDDFYVAMLPAEPESEEDAEEVLLMRLVEEEDDDVFYPIESEEQLEKVFNAFVELYYADEDEE